MVIEGWAQRNDTKDRQMHDPIEGYQSSRNDIIRSMLMKHTLILMASLILGLTSCKQTDEPEVIQTMTLESATYTTNRLIWHEIATHVDTQSSSTVFDMADALVPGVGDVEFWMAFDADTLRAALKLDSLGATREDTPKHRIYTLANPLDVTLYNAKETNRWYMTHAARIYTKDCISEPSRIEETMQSIYKTIR